MRRFIPLVLGGLVPLLVASPSFAKGAAPAKPPASAPPSDPAKARADGTRRALEWLEANLDRVPEAAGTPRKPFTVAIAALDELLAAGSTHDRSPVDRVRRAVAYLSAWEDEVLVRSRDPSQIPERHGVADSRVLAQYTWPLGAALTLFAECRARGILERETLRPVQTAVTVLQEAQDSNGGFGHGRISGPPPPPPPRTPPGTLVAGAGGYPATLVSATNVVAVGLGLARPWLAKDAEPTLARLREHYPRAILANGNYPYDHSQRAAGIDTTGVGRTAGAIAAMLALGGSTTDETVRRAAGFLDPRLPLLAEGHGSPALNLFLGAIQARMRGPEAVRAFESAYVPRILAKQAADGSLDCVCEGTGFGVTCDSPETGLLASSIPSFALGQRAYVTALHLFVLLLDGPDRMRALASPPPAPPAPPTTTPTEPPAGPRR